MLELLELDLAPDAKKLRSFGLIALVFFGGLGGYAAWRGSLLGFGLGTSAPTVGMALSGLALLCGLLAVVFPRALLPLYVGLTLLTLPIGLVVSHVVMLSLFFLVITPLGIAMRLSGWDAMERKLDRGGASYWRRRSGAPPVDRYFRQF